VQARPGIRTSGVIAASASAALALALFATALFTFIIACLTFPLQAGFLVRGRDGVEARADHRARGLGRAPDHGGGSANDRADQTALERQTARGDQDGLREVEQGSSTAHEDGSRDAE